MLRRGRAGLADNSDPFDSIFNPGLGWARRRNAIIQAIQTHTGLEPTSTALRTARYLLNEQAVDRPGTDDQDFAVAMFLLARTAQGRRVHVLDMGLRGQQMSHRLAPLLEAAGVSWVRQSRDSTVPERSHAYRADILFARPQQVALDILLSRFLAQPPRDGLRAHVARMSKNLVAVPGPQGDMLDCALVLDGEDTLCGRALTVIVASDTDSSATSLLTAEEALGVAAQMTAQDFWLSEKDATLTQQGRERLRTISGTLGPDWVKPALGELAVRRALMTLHLWRENEHYVIRGDEVIPVAPELTPDNPTLGLAPLDFLKIKTRVGHEERRQSVERMTLRTLLLRYRSLACLVDSLNHHAAELQSAYSIKPAFQKQTLSPNLWCLVDDDLPELIRSVSQGAILPVVLKGDEEWADGIGQSLCESDLPMFFANSLEQDCLPEEAATTQSGIVWVGHPTVDLLERLITSVAPYCTVVVISRVPGNWCRIDKSLPVLRIVAIGDHATLASPMKFWRKLFVSRIGRSTLIAPALRSYARYRLRVLLKKEAWLRDQLFEFDTRCRRAVSFLTKPWE